MTTSFANQVAEKQKSKETPVVAPQAEAAVLEAPESEVVDDQAEDTADYEEQPQESQISKDNEKRLKEAGSFLDLINESNKKKADEEAAELEAQEAELEQEEAELEAEAQAKAEEEAKPTVFEIDGQTFDSPEKVNEYLTTVKEESEALKKEVDDIRAFVEKVSDPEMLDVLQLVSQGYSFRTAMVKAGLDESIFHIEADDEDAEALVQAKIERKQAIQQQAKEQEKLHKNMEQSNKVLTEFQAEEGFDEKTKESLVTLMTEIHNDVLNGLVTKKALQIFAKALNYEKVVEESKKKVEEAKAIGKIQGRNEKIEIERQRKDGDNIPRLGRGISSEPMPRRNALNDLVSMPPSSFREKLKNQN